ncbi:MAG TPA: phage baseplate assembly protein V [Pyrinomonadaceae bacterium]|jgi:hypothetical protein
MNLQRLVNRQAQEAGDERWLEGLEAIVAINEDPEFQHRIKVIIPALDENNVYDKWVRSLSVFVLGQGYGSFFVPPIGSEVTLFSRLGAKHNLFYLPTYNEDFIVPADFRDPAVAGIRAPGDLRFICDGDMQLRFGGLRMQADFGAINLTAPGGVFINGRPY